MTQVSEDEEGEEVRHVFTYEVMEYDETTHRVQAELTDQESGSGVMTEIIFQDNTRETFQIRTVEYVNNGDDF